MESKKIKLVLKGADKDWTKDGVTKVLRKRTIVFEDDTNGELTLFPEQTEPEAGQTIEFEMQDNGFGNEIKLKKTGGGGFGGGFGKRTPHDLAMLNSNAIMKSLIEAKALSLNEWKAQYIDCYRFFIKFEDNMKEDTKPQETPNDLPFDV